MKKELTEASITKIGEELKKKYNLSLVILMVNQKEKPTQILGHIAGKDTQILKNIITTMHTLLEMHGLKNLSPEDANLEPTLWKKIQELSAYLQLLYEAKEGIFNNDEE